MSEQTAMDRWVGQFATRDEIAVEYGKLLRSGVTSEVTWAVLNLAIIDRWSESGLRYIKAKAWSQAGRSPTAAGGQR